MVITPGTGSSITSAMTVSIALGPFGFLALALFRAILFAARVGLSFTPLLFDVALAPDRFAVVLRADVEVFLRVADFRFLVVARFFR